MERMWEAREVKIELKRRIFLTGDILTNFQDWILYTILLENGI